MGPIDCPETSLINYLYTQRNNPEERSSDLLRGSSMKSRNCEYNSLLPGGRNVIREEECTFFQNPVYCALAF